MHCIHLVYIFPGQCHTVISNLAITRIILSPFYNAAVYTAYSEPTMHCIHLVTFIGLRGVATACKRLPRVCLKADSAQKKKRSYDAAFKLKVLDYASQHSNRAAAFRPLGSPLPRSLRCACAFAHSSVIKAALEL